MNKSKASSKRHKKARTFEITARAAFFWSFCLFFLLAWIFVLGIFVGRGFIPEGIQDTSELRAQISKLQHMLGYGDSSKPETQKTPFEDPKLAFYEKLATKKRDVARKSLSTKRVRKQKKPAVYQGKSVEKQVNKKRVDGQTAGSFTIQVASLGVAAKAKALAQKLGAKGYPAYYYEVKIKGRPWYRVRCGSFKTTAEAKQFAQRLYKDERIKGFVLRGER